MKRAKILAIGTEITTGDIVNSNAAWLSEKLVEIGFDVVAHLCVPDERHEILNALNFLHEKDSALLITGGLGPTSDDFTRDVVAEWSGDALEYRESSWERIETLLNSRGVKIAESNKRQCYFPKSSKVLSNAAGTADAFGMHYKDQWIVVLPGPPKELQRIWQDHLEAQFEKLIPQGKKKFLLQWHCIGESESRLGEMVGDCLNGSGLEIGYRARIPYVDVKVWVTDIAAAQTWIQKLEERIGKFVITKDKEDLANIFVRKLFQSDPHTQIIDGCGGMLARRILGENISSKISFGVDVESFDGSFFFVGDVTKENIWRWGFCQNGDGAKIFEETTRIKGSDIQERLRKMNVELAMHKYLQKL